MFFTRASHDHGSGTAYDRHYRSYAVPLPWSWLARVKQLTYSCTPVDSKSFVAMIVMACLDLYVTPVNKKYTSNVHMYNDWLSTLLDLTFKHYFHYTLYTYKNCKQT